MKKNARLVRRCNFIESANHVKKKKESRGLEPKTFRLEGKDVIHCATLPDKVTRAMLSL
jgi:hypothetical protein